MKTGSAQYNIPGGPGPQGPPGPSGGTQINYWFHDDPSSIPTYFQILDSPANGSESDDSVSVVAVDGEKLIEAYATNVGVPGVTSIPAGNWTFSPYVYASVLGVAQIVLRVYKRDVANVETLLFLVTTTNILSGVATPQIINYASPAIALAATDRIVVKVLAKSNVAFATIVHFVHDGTLHASWFSAPASLSMTSVFPVDVSELAASIGTSLEKAQADHRHHIAHATDLPGLATIAASLVGTSLEKAQANHTHQIDPAAIVSIISAVQASMPQWRTVLEQDFTVLPNATYNSDGPVVIGGENWRIENHGNIYLGQTMQLVNGFGLLQVRPGSGFSNDVTLRTGALYSWELPPAATPLTPVRVVVRCTLGTGFDNYAGAVLGVDYPSSVVGYRSGYLVSRVGTKSDQVNATCSNAGVRITRGTSVSPVNEGDINYIPGNDYPQSDADLIGLWLPEGVSHVARMVYLRGRRNDGSWADMSQLRIINEIDSSVSHAATKPQILANDILSPWRVSLYGIGTNSPQPQTAYIAEIKVQLYY
jgi:hypothetical protein